MMYPYKLIQNPYPSSPTPAVIDTRILGGNRHKEGKSALLSCINELFSKIKGNATEKDFRLITVIQDVGSGKTHLAFHLKGLQHQLGNVIISYCDLAQISPRSIHDIYGSLLKGFSDEYVNDFRKQIIYYLKDKAKHSKNARKIFGYGFFDSFTGKKIEDKVEKFLESNNIPDSDAVCKVLSEEFCTDEISVLKLFIEGKFRTGQAKTLGEIIENLSALAKLNFKFLKKLTLLEIDEFDADKESMAFVKAIVNAHLPSTALLLILTPSSYQQIQAANSSVFDRLEKANYKIDLAGSNTFEEILDIILEYVRYYDNGKNFSLQEERELASKIKVIYDEFPDFRNVRSMINILYHATENAAGRDTSIDERALEETIKKIYPGLRIKGSIMSVPVSDFIKIQKNYNDAQTMESDLRAAIRNLVDHAHKMGTVTTLENLENPNGIELVYGDACGMKVAVAVVLNKDDSKNFQLSCNSVGKTVVDKVVILTDSNIALGRGAEANGGETVVNIDRSKMIDLLYFNSIYKRDEIKGDDLERALALAKSIKLC
ncbi:MAG TPA: hypothetical protein VEH06_08460 [Candidatus Bathyarchaeia archaeon]|nr:hypothetical protein [Candidatus Bathyarchaeia archaeon]